MAAVATAMEAFAERVRLMESEVTRHREMFAESENLRLRLDAAEQRLAMRKQQRAGERDSAAGQMAAAGGQMVDTILLNKPRTFTRFAAMMGRTIRYKFPDPVMTNLAEFEQLVMECTDHSGDVISAGNVAAVCRKEKADKRKARKVSALTDASKGPQSTATTASGLQGNGVSSQTSLAPAVDVAHVAAVLAQMQLRQQRSSASTSSTVHVANVRVGEREHAPTLEEYYWQVGILYNAMQCDGSHVGVGETAGFDWALSDAGSGLTTCPKGLASATAMPPPKNSPLRESATGDEVKSTGARIASAESDGAPLQIEFQATNAKRAIVSADAFTEGGRVPCGKTFWQRRPAENVTELIYVNPAQPTNQTAKQITRWSSWLD
ncbi:unnamed protein product [Prorocentrum cordatum]|uniref:Uncharacterized protein n=1 Tax=Prorocentrum cordatum TaxID=2364126 RepID=A0ABN9SY16_9DINO|nr:unnamed protein product [Polarella glacialis]